MNDEQLLELTDEAIRGMAYVASRMQCVRDRVEAGKALAFLLEARIKLEGERCYTLTEAGRREVVKEGK